jgi:predicted CXXCH cytochrome family protein
VLPATGDYAAYTVYDNSAPVARPTVVSSASASVDPGDMVMCLSCHVAHGSANDYLLRFDYTTMTAGNYATIGDAQAAGGCLACHTEKGVLPSAR